MRPLLALLVLTCACAPPAEWAGTGSTVHPILGGDVADDDPQVFQLLAVVDGGAPLPFCTATLISRRTLATAAHCVDIEPGDFGGTTLAILATNRSPSDQATAAERFAVAAIGILPTWEPETGADDLALLLLDTTPPVEPKASNAQALGYPIVGATVRVVGYGVSDLASDDAGVRRTVSLPVDSLESRDLRLQGAGPCYGDGGAPVFWTSDDGVERVVGVFSSSSETCMDPRAARIDVHASLIQGWIAANEPEPSCAADGGCVEVCPEPDPDCGGQGGSGGQGGGGGDDPGGGPPAPHDGGGDSGGCSSASARPGLAWLLVASCVGLCSPRRRLRW